MSGELSYASRLEACLSGWFGLLFFFLMLLGLDFFFFWLEQLSDVELAPPTAEIMP